MQKQQLGSLSLKFDAEAKSMRAQQTKKSIDDSKALQQVSAPGRAGSPGTPLQDRGISKAERDRRNRELNEKNLKLFMEERKRLQIRRERHLDQLRQRHKEQNEALAKEFSKVSAGPPP